MEMETTSGSVGDIGANKRPRAPSASEHACSASCEEHTRKRPHTEEHRHVSTIQRQIGHSFENSVARDQARVHYGDSYNEIHHHHHGQSRESYGQRGELRSLDAAKVRGETAEYIARVLEDLSFKRMGLRKGTIAPALANTCQWLLARADYTGWRNPDYMNDHHGFMWIKSKPGAGKSTLMKFLLESTQTRYPDDTALSFFFNARGDAYGKSLIGLYRHLLYQLLSSVRRLIPSVIDDVSRLASSGWQIETLRNIFRTAVLDLQSERVTCFIDALDESSEDEVRDLIDFFEDLGNDVVAKGITFRVCFSSRHYPHVELVKCQYLNMDNQPEHQQDITLYVRSKLRLSKGAISDEILVSIQQRAQGVFLWVVLVVQILRKDYQRGNMHKVRGHLDELPDGLHNLFHEMVNRDTDDRDDKRNFASILQWIAFARRPLTPIELYLFIRSEHSDFDFSRLWDHDTVDFESVKLFILNCSRGLAEITTSGIIPEPTVQFIHESVRDYLQEKGFGMLIVGRSTPLIGLANDHLKHGCLRWISSSVIETLRARQPIFLIIRPISYALAEMIDHAEVACANGVAQDDFVNGFSLEVLEMLDRLCGGNTPTIFRYSMSLVEILVHLSAKNLLAIVFRNLIVRNRGDVTMAIHQLLDEVRILDGKRSADYFTSLRWVINGDDHEDNRDYGTEA